METQDLHSALNKNLKKSNLNVIGDAAGNYLTVQALLEQMPEDAFTLFLGDLNDRGPRTNQLIQDIIDNPDKMDSIDSNHGEMFVDWFKATIGVEGYRRKYDQGVFLMNGGMQTIHSYITDPDKPYIQQINVDHINWLDARPMCLQNDQFFFSHAPVFIAHSLDQLTSRGNGFYDGVDPVSRGNLLWNRYAHAGFHPEIGNKINIYGHNSRSKPVLFCHQYQNGIKITSNDQFHELLEINKGQVYGIDLDTSASGILTGLHLPTMTLYSQNYID